MKAALTASVEALTKETEAVEAEIVELSNPPKVLPTMTSLMAVDAALADIEARQKKCAEQRAYLEQLRSKMPMVRDLLSKATAQEQPARQDVRNAEEDCYSGYLEQVDLAEILEPLRRWIVAMQGSGRYWWENKLRETLIIAGADEQKRVKAEMTAWLAIPQPAPVPDDEPVAVEPGRNPVTFALAETSRGTPVAELMTALGEQLAEPTPVTRYQEPLPKQTGPEAPPTYIVVGR